MRRLRFRRKAASVVLVRPGVWAVLLLDTGKVAAYFQHPLRAESLANNINLAANRL